MQRRLTERLRMFEAENCPSLCTEVLDITWHNLVDCVDRKTLHCTCVQNNTLLRIVSFIEKKLIHSRDLHALVEPLSDNSVGFHFLKNGET